MNPISNPLARPHLLPLRGVTQICAEPVLVVAPHPDDEALGCGGAIALLRLMGYTVRVLVVSDGTQSHPHSQKYPKAALQQLRAAETIAAMGWLGVDKSELTFLQLPDGGVPGVGSLGFASAVDRCHAYLLKTAPQLVFLPWRHDPHPDHRATWQIFKTAIDRLAEPPRSLEYPIWDWDVQQRDLSHRAIVTPWRLDISPVLELKRQAIDLYLSQLTDTIDDDPTGFRLSPDMLANFTQPWEVYFEFQPQ
jgi:LmbE family N-acetylglucosaminyl deacetylase